MPHRTPRKFPFPWRLDNRFELLVDGKAFFPEMLGAIGRAQHYILLEIYLFESGAVATRFIDAFARAVARGVTVKLLLDAFGAAKLLPEDRARMTSAGIDLVFYNPIQYRKLLHNMFRDHRKLLIVDGEVAFVSGAGITDEFDSPADPARSWRETAVRIEGPVLADWQELFLRVWNHHAETLALAPVPARTFQGGSAGRVVTTSALVVQDIKRSLYSRVRRAQRRVWIATAYFVPSHKVRRALRLAAAAGVDVRLLLPGRFTDHPGVRHAGRRFYSKLLRHGVRIFEYQPRFLHAKAMLCDDWVSIGSSNLDRWNLRWNLEANQEIEDPAFAARVGAMFEVDFAQATECRYEDWRRRPWHARLREHWWGRVDMWLEGIGRLRSGREHRRRR